MRVLIADDDPIIRLDLRQMLENLGYEIIAEAGDGIEAVNLAEANKPDMCILDVKMPHQDGIDAAAKIADGGIAPVILLTAYSDKELVERAKEAGVFGYLVKPFKPGDLPPAIEVARSRYEANLQLSQEVASLEDRLETRKLIDRAKGILMKTQNVTEAEAYRRIQTQSMNARKSMKEVAEAIILATSV
ncbi:MAG: putative transcriptional regulatory protein pdtaR [Fimbriimonadaceae bacterium]|nr:putative transcriptional regulatory protein pdtaR [Fimbriimonadaceae bacterium]